MAVLFEADIHAVARGAGNFRDDDAIPFALVNLGDRIDQRALAGISLADNGHEHLRHGNFFGSLREIDIGGDGIADLIDIADVGGGDADGGAQSKAGKFAKRCVEARAVGLVGNQNRPQAFLAEHRRDFLIGAGQAVLHIDDEHHRGGPGHGHFDLMADVIGEGIGIDKSIAAGIDQLDKSAVDIQRR